MEARAAKCCLHTSQRGPPEPTDGLNHANKDRTFGSVCWCQHGPPATSAVAVSPASSERIRLLTELRRLSAAAQDRLYYPVYITGQEVRTIWRLWKAWKSFILLLYMVKLAKVRSGRILKIHFSSVTYFFLMLFMLMVIVLKHLTDFGISGSLLFVIFHPTHLLTLQNTQLLN